jgi:hypothetical protein
VTDPVSVSNSEIQTFKSCRRKWWLSYYLKYKPREKSFVGALPLGSRVHKALELHYKNGDDLLSAHAALVEVDRMGMEMAGVDSSTLDSDADLGRLMLEGYQEWVATEGLDANLEVISVEEILRMPTVVPEGEIEVIGKIDLRVRNLFDGTRSVLDFKTAQAFETFTTTAHLSEQLLTYMVLDHLNTPEADDTRIGGGIYRILKKVKRGPRAVPPFYLEVPIRHNTFTLRAFWKRLHGLLNDMLRVRKALDEGHDPLEVVYPNPSADCRWKCPFFALCPMFDDGAGAGTMLDELYEIGDPYAYYADDAPTTA